MTALFSCQGLTKRYGAGVALRDLDLTVDAGRCVALLGHNGAGKTTLIKLLLGLTAPSAGQVRLFGQNPSGRSGSRARRDVGYLPENVVLDQALSGHELLAFYGALKGVGAADCARVLDQVGLGEAAGRRLGTYSKGMRQRLGLAQALLGEPRLLLLDEPTNGLDPPLRRQFYAAVRERIEQGATALISSHALVEIEAQADQIVILRQGALVAAGTLEALRRASGLPHRLRLQVGPEAAGGIAETIGRDFALTGVENGRMEFVCNGADKMTIVRRVAALNGVIKDVDFLPPRLEEIYAHFVAQGAPR